MARVVVVGGGFGGMASAARLAKLGHQVTLVEAARHLGGALGFVEQDGFRWDSGASVTLLPAVVRDLFRKTGRPLERELDLVPVEPVQQHRFEDGTVLDLPAGSRGRQHDAVARALGDGTGKRRHKPAADEWVDYVHGFAEVWDALRRDWLERPWSAEHASSESRDLLATRSSLHKYTQRLLRDERLRRVATFRAVLEGQQPRDLPAWFGMWSYVEQNFGAWTVPGGMGLLARALEERLATRRVTVLTGTAARDLAVSGNRVAGVRTDDGDVDADVVVCAVDPRRLPVLAPYVARTMPAIPPVVCHLGIVGDLPDLPHEVVLHGDPMIVLRTRGTAPEGAHAWTLLGRGRLAEDMVSTVQRAGIRVRDGVEVRVDRSPRDLVQEWGGSPMGVLWQGRGTLAQRMGTRAPVEGVYLAGAHTTPGAGLPSVGLSAALVAQLVGPA
ncbi:MAG TPA: FAD-dependent oxidoreductase [Marmoricola sp.]|nr:FAD-dependent oxidoreductase [Marmoricola sp.]